jgi:hypothetical protein
VDVEVGLCESLVEPSSADLVVDAREVLERRPQRPGTGAQRPGLDVPRDGDEQELALAGGRVAPDLERRLVEVLNTAGRSPASAWTSPVTYRSL